MAVFVGNPLSGSTNGRPIPVVATATAGTLIHTAVAGTAGYDEVFIWASNVTAAVATLTLEFGGVADPGDHLIKNYSIAPYSGGILVVAGQRVQGGVAIRAFSGTASAINLTGFYDRRQ